MASALALDPKKVKEKCDKVKQVLNGAHFLDVKFEVKLPDGRPQVYSLTIDVRFRQPRSELDDLGQTGYVGNLPLGEVYTSPYEGEHQGIQSLTEGILPIAYRQTGEVVLFEVKGNRITGVLNSTPRGRQELQWIREDPARGNIAEAGFGILSELGIMPVNAILLDEKTAFHIALGRSDHLDTGGVIGPDQFKLENATHLDFVYNDQFKFMFDDKFHLRVRSIVVRYSADKPSYRLIHKSQYVLP